jgi:hypothetical protein
MIARPFVKPAGAAALWGGPRQTERLFVLDDSLSMAYQSAEGTSFSKAKVAVGRLLTTIRQETPDDTVTLLRMSAPAAPIESGAYLDETQTANLLARLDALTPSQQAIDLPAVIENVADMLKSNPDITGAAVYIVSDFQRHDWVRGGATAKAETGESNIFQPLTAWAEESRGLRLVLINVGEDEAPNLAVTELELDRRRLVASTPGAVRAKVANFSHRPIENLEVVLSVGHIVQPSETLRELAPRQSASVDLEAELLQTGWESVRVELAPDALPWDDVRYATAEVAGAIRVLIVNGEPSADHFDDEVTFLTTALRPEGEVFSGNEVEVVDEVELEETNLADFHVVLLANVYRVSEPAVDSLERFVRAGGGLQIFLGDQVDADLYNVALYRGGKGLLPGELREVVRPARPSHLTITDRLHPAMRGLGGEGDPLGVGEIAFFEYFGCVPHAVTPEEQDDLGPEPGALARADTARHVRPARVIARFDDADEHPAIVERSVGLGTVLLVTTAVDKEWHHWPDHPTFLPTMMELTRHVARRGGDGGRYRVGEAIEFPVDAAAFEPDVLVRRPGYPNEQETELTATPASDAHGLMLKWEHTDVAGVYQFVLRKREGGETVRLVAVNVDPRESDLTMAEEDELRGLLGDVPFDYVKGIDELTGAMDTGRMELWRFFLVAAVLVLMSEQCLAWWWGRRG